MNIKEGVNIKTTPAPKKRRNQPGYWNWGWLVKLIEEAQAFGSQMTKREGIYMAVVIPNKSPFSDRATQEQIDKHEKVQVLLYTLANTLYVEKGETIPCPHEKELDKT